MDKIQKRHAPENAEHELKIAYNCVIEAEVTHFWERRPIPGVNADEVTAFYNKALAAYKNNERLTAERWARTAKHLARALWHEAKIDYLAARASALEYLGNASEEFNLHEHSDTTADLLDAVGKQIMDPFGRPPPDMDRYVNLGKHHLHMLEEPGCTNELLRAEHIKAAYEYGRTVECLVLACECEVPPAKAAA